MSKEVYFETTEFNNESDFKRGDVVRMYKESSTLEYPCLILGCEKLELFRVEAIKSLLTARSLLQGDANLYNVYINLTEN